VIAGSIALTGFGLDSSIEVLASAVAAWQLRRPTSARSRIALRVIGVSYVVVAGWVGVESVRRLVGGRHAEASALGVAVTAAAVVAMTALGVAKRRIARRLRNEVLRAEANFSLVDATLSATVLAGLVLDRTLGWWWADPAAAVAVALVAAREGVSELGSS
jgi:divalent metal cation (Fe/Co/Zn/Cd) transporter